MLEKQGVYDFFLLALTAAESESFFIAHNPVMPLRSLHQLLVLQMWVLKREKSALAGPLFLIWVLERQSGPHCRHYMSRLTAAVKQGVTPCNSASSSEKTSPAVISNRENRIVTVLSSRNRLTCTADYFAQWRSCRGKRESFCLWQITEFPFHQGLSRKDKIFILHVDWKLLLQEKYERDPCALRCCRERVHRLSCCSLVNPLWDFVRHCLGSLEWRAVFVLL